MFDLELKSISKSYKHTTVLHDISLSVEQGEFISLLGPSGCGKTTTLRTIAGYIEPTKGEVLIRGENVTRKPPYLRNNGMVFQNYALFPHLTVYENIAFGLRLRKVKSAQIDVQVRQMLEVVDLPGFENKYPAECSGGQQQRIALARALVIQPYILLLDEPLSNLDTRLRIQMRNELKRIHRQVGITSVFVTHDHDEAFSLSDRVIIMNGGRIEQIGTPEQVFHQPATRFVADFLGYMNFFYAKPVGAGDQSLLVELAGNDGAAKLKLRNKESCEVCSSADLCLTIRPEQVKLSPYQESVHELNEQNRIRGQIKLVTYHGSTSQYIVESNYGTFISSGFNEWKLVEGDRVWIDLPAEHLVLLAV